MITNVSGVGLLKPYIVEKLVSYYLHMAILYDIELYICLTNVDALCVELLKCFYSREVCKLLFLYGYIMTLTCTPLNIRKCNLPSPLSSIYIRNSYTNQNYFIIYTKQLCTISCNLVTRLSQACYNFMYKFATIRDVHNMVE